MKSQQTILKKIFGTLAIVTMVCAGVSTAMFTGAEEAQATGVHRFDTPQCPFPSKEGRTIVDFSDALLLSSIKANAKSAPQKTNLVAGSYEVRLASYDGYEGRKDTDPAGQKHEVWRAQLKNGNDVIAETRNLKDLKDGVNEASEQGMTDSELVLSEDVDTAIAVHPFYKNGHPNSVTPICAAFDLIEAAEEEPQVCSCEMTASKTKITRGETVELSWTTVNASSASIDNNVGTVDVNGSVTVSPTETTKYVGTFRAVADGEPSFCDVTVTVEEPVTNPPSGGGGGGQDPAPMCSLTANPTSINPGDAVTLSWTSSNATTGTVDNSIGSVDLNGSTTTNPSGATTYTASFSNADNETVTCSAAVSLVSSGGGSGGGGSAGGGGGGSVSKKPPSGGAGRCLNCDTPSKGGDGGSGGSNSNDPGSSKNESEPTIVLAQTEVQSAQPGSFVYLDQIPYTGVELSPTLTAIFWTLLFAASALISYLLVAKRVFSRAVAYVAAQGAQDESYNKAWNKFAQEQQQQTQEKNQPYVHATADIAATLPQSYQFQSMEFNRNKETTPTMQSELELQAQKESILFSPEALEFVEETGLGSNSTTFVSSLIENAKASFPREDGWILISKERAQTLLVASEQPQEQVVAQSAPVTQAQQPVAVQAVPQPVAAQTQQVAAQAATATAALANENKAAMPAGTISTFITWLVQGEEQNAYEFIRKISSQGYPVGMFIGQVVRSLDEVYKHRIEGDRNPDPTLTGQTATWSNEDFEAVLGILVESIDHSYNSTRIGAKIALAKVFEHFANNKK